MSTILLIPGLRGDSPDHWQSRLAATHSAARVVGSFDRHPCDLDGRVADLDRAVAEANGPVTLVAHSAGVLVTVHWATRHATAGGIRGALLATPPDLADELPPAYPRLAELRAAGWLPVPGTPLPFPSLVAASTDDPLGDPGRVRAMAADWGASVVELGPVGHLNPASGFGPWPGVRHLLARLVRQPQRATAAGSRARGA